jgi:hypothetical protein
VAGLEALLEDPAARAKMSNSLEMRLLILSGQLELQVADYGEVGASEMPEEISEAPSANVQVNDSTTDVGQSTTQSETSMRVNPISGTICSAYNDSQHFAVGSIAFAGFSRSTDGGATFVDKGPIPPGGGGNSFGDPALVWRQLDGAFYYASLHSNGLGLWRSGDDCDSFAFNSMIHFGLGDDKELMAVDNNPASPFYGRLYVAWTNFGAGEVIVLTWSDDGLVWSSPVTLSAFGADVQGAWPTVAPNGDVYVSWVRWNPYFSGPIDIEVVRSTNGGANFGFVTNPMTGKPNPREASATLSCGRPALHANVGDGIRYLPSPQIQVGPDGCLHVVYSYDSDGLNVGDVIDVFYRRSCTDGATWEPEFQLNDDGTLTDQWFPTISVGSTNQVAATWYDRRLDTANNYLFDYYVRMSPDGGTTWMPSTRVTDVSSAVPQLVPNFDPIINVCYHGDYDEQRQHGGSVYIQWSDDRNIQNGHPDPDIWFARMSTCDSGTLKGSVTDSVSGGPIEGAQVAADGSSTLTDAAGEYEMFVCVGTYDVTASAFGYLSETVAGVTIIDGTETVLDFALDSAATVQLSGTVSDTTTGWPLYAEVSFPAGSTWSDPVSGAYSVDMPAGTYDFVATASVAGYDPATATLALNANTLHDFELQADTLTCDAPGYEHSGYFEAFESDDGGYTHAGIFDQWEWGSPSVWPFGCASGAGCWCTNLDGNYSDNADNSLTSPVIDLSGLSPGTPIHASWWQAIQIENEVFDRAYAEVSINFGPWQEMWRHTGSTTQIDWRRQPDSSYDISAAAGGTVRFRWRMETDGSVVYPGLCIDDVLISGLCTPPSDGGLVVGNVLDENLGDGLVDATVSSDVGDSTTSRPTPDDPDVDDGFYTLYVPSGTHDLTASAGESGYGADTESVNVVDLGTALQEFELPAGLLSADPNPVGVSVVLDGTLTLPVALVNNGGLAALFDLQESDSPPPLTPAPLPTGPFAVPTTRVGSKDLESPSTDGIDLPSTPSDAPILAAGDVLQSWAPGSNAMPWGIASDLDGEVWVADGWTPGGQNFEYEADGSPTGLSWPYPWATVSGPADGAFNWNTGTIWSLDVGGDTCLHELDPASGYTGALVCGPWSISQRGAAYDPANDTWFVGGWNEGVIYHIDSSGVLLDSSFVGLLIAGLAYNPETEHLFVIENTIDNDQILVLDAASGYAPVGQIPIPFGSNAGAGLEIDCDGNLWAVDQMTRTVYLFDSGEAAPGLCFTDVPWLSLSPTSGTVAPHDEALVSFDFDATGLTLGTHEAWVRVTNDTPYGRFNIPVTMVVDEGPASSIVSYAVEGGMPHSETLQGATVRPADAARASTGELIFDDFPDTILEDIDAFALLPDGSVVFSTSTDVTQGFGGLGPFKDGDLVRWDGTEAERLFSENAGFGGANQNIDAFSILPSGNWLLSTSLTATLGGLTFLNGSIVEYDPVADVATLYMGLDEASIFTGSPQSNADIDALHVASDGSVVLSIRSDGIGRIGSNLTYDFSDAPSRDLYRLDVSTGEAELFLEGAGLYDGVARNLDAVSLGRATVAVPEPGQILMLAAGLAFLTAAGRRRRHA